MSSKSHIKFHVVLGLLLPLLLSGCLTLRIRSKRNQVCRNLGFLTTSIALMRRANNASLPDLQQAQERVTDAFTAVKTSIGPVLGLEIEELEQLEAAYNNLDQAIEDIPDESLDSEAIASIAIHITAIETATTQVKSRLRCR